MTFYNSFFSFLALFYSYYIDYVEFNLCLLRI